MDPQKEQEFYNARVKETDGKIRAEFERGHKLTFDDKAFLKARSSYLTRAEAEEYKDELADDLTKSPYFGKVRKELEQMATDLGIEDVSMRTYKTNGDLIDAIEAAKVKA